MFTGRDGVPRDENPFEGPRISTTALMMCSYDRSLYGNGKWHSDAAGNINPGQVLTMQLDLNAGTLKFWLDGKRHGLGWTSVVHNPLW